MRQTDDDTIAKMFRDLTLKGKVTSALNYLSRITTGGVLQQASKGRAPPSPIVIDGVKGPSNPTLFDSLNANAILQSALHIYLQIPNLDVCNRRWRNFIHRRHHACRVTSWQRPCMPSPFLLSLTSLKNIALMSGKPGR